MRELRPSWATSRLLRAWRTPSSACAIWASAAAIWASSAPCWVRASWAWATFVGDGHLLELDGLRHSAGVGEALNLVIFALGLADVDGGLADLGFLDGELCGGSAGEQLAIAGLGAGEGGFGAGDAGLGDGHVGLGGDDIGVGGRFLEFFELGAADLEGDFGLFKSERGVGDIELGEELAGLYGLADGNEDLLDAAAGAEGEGDFGFGFDAAGCADGTTDGAALDCDGFVAGLFVQGGAALLELLESKPTRCANDNDHDNRDQEIFHLVSSPACRRL